MLLYSTQLSVGWNAPDFTLPDSSGNFVTLSTLLPKRGILIIFTCNHCPYAQASWPVLVSLYKRYQKRGFEFLAINPNDSKAFAEDGISGMNQIISKYNILFPYLRDETQEVAKKYSAQCTPDLYLLNKEKKLFYHGRINDNWQDPLKTKRNDLDEALNRMFIGDKPPVEQFPSMGCSIKWR